MSITNTVQIPKGYFLKQSKQEYASYAQRLVQELFQNSVDAGATEIKINFKNDGYEMIDNGKGMNRETMVDAMLTFGGTQKDEGNAGGFGHAKILLLFSMDSFTIQSRNTTALGEGLNYEIGDSEYLNGTIVTGKFAKEWDVSAERMALITKSFLQKCDLKAKVYINDTEYTNWMITNRAVRKNEWSKLYSKKTTYDCYYLYVRKNGLFMFEKYMGEPMKKEVILDITGDSKEVLNANRDGFKSEKDNEFSKLFAEICADKNSFDRKRTAKWIFKGKMDAFYDDFLAKIENVFSNESEPTYNPECVAVAADIKTLIEKKDIAALKEIEVESYNFGDLIASGLRTTISNAINFIGKSLEADFIVDLGDSGYSTIPKRYHTNTMSEFNKSVARLWKSCLQTVMEANKMSAQYRIGFTLNSDREAQYSRVNGIEELLINPSMGWIESLDKWEKCYHMLSLAAHEITHRTCTYHDENFVSKSENLLIKTLTFIKGDTNFVTKRAKNIAL